MSYESSGGPFYERNYDCSGESIEIYYIGNYDRNYDRNFMRNYDCNYVRNYVRKRPSRAFVVSRIGKVLIKIK